MWSTTWNPFHCLTGAIWKTTSSGLAGSGRRDFRDDLGRQSLRRLVHEQKTQSMSAHPGAGVLATRRCAAI